MKWINYSRYTGEEDGISSEDLMRAISDFLLRSGFENQYMNFGEMDERSLDELREAIERALREGDLSERLEKMSSERIDELVDRMIQKLEEDGYVDVQDGDSRRQPKFEITDKSVDFLGFKTLKELMAGLGRASFGAHDTREMSTGVETSGSSKPYEFGDTLNLDVCETLFSALKREGMEFPLQLEYGDLHVHQSEYQSSCATVLMLDCSHSMILYGEDRFTPAKRVALALAHLIRTQYPGDSLRLVLFHDGAEELRLSDLARAQVGPYYTNTRDGLILAQRLLAREKKDMKQIIMITDGKPSCLTLDDGRVYRNAFGLDPLVISRTLEEVARCKRQGILINTFMLASDYGLVQFVQKVTELCRGKAYFTTPYNLGEYLLMDYMNRKTRNIH
jgi:Ca-activated chloride channel family protein